jgi:hypothetical protein
MTTSRGTAWRPDDGTKPAPERPESEIFRPDVLTVIERKIHELSDDLRALSLDIHGDDS